MPDTPQGQRLLRTLTTLVKILIAGVVVIGVFLFVLEVQIQQRNETTDKLRDDMRELSGNVSSLSESVDDVQAFVNDFREQTPDEVERDAAIGAAVAQVPELRSILCEAFPETSPCRATPG